MPKPRKENTLKPQRRIFIVCEGSVTEPTYFQSLIDALVFPGELVHIRVLHPGKTSNRELVEAAIEVREMEIDESWVVVDKDGYTKHHEAFDMAKSNNIQIAFSSISFEMWILLHFAYSTKEFSCCSDLMKELKGIYKYDYEKNSSSLYEHISGNYDKARRNAERLRKYQSEVNPGKMIFDLNPYTDVDLLVEHLKKLKIEIEAAKNNK